MNKKILANLMVCLMLATTLTVFFSVNSEGKKVDLDESENTGTIKVKLKFESPALPFPHEVFIKKLTPHRWYHAYPTYENNGKYSCEITGLVEGWYRLSSAPAPPFKAETIRVYLNEGEYKEVELDIFKPKSKSCINLIELLELLNIKGLFFA